MPNPLPVGTTVRHINQEWARAATATVEVVEGPWPDGSYEYQVLAGEDFSRRLGPDNPQTRAAWWSSRAVEQADRPAAAVPASAPEAKQ